MCGIQLGAWKDKSCELCQLLFRNDCDTDNNALRENESPDDNLRRRGPDWCKMISIAHPNYHRIRCAASVLQMRAQLQEQPVAFEPAWSEDKFSGNGIVRTGKDDEEFDEQSAYLCWNGEIYQQIEVSLSNQTKCDSRDTKEAFMYDVVDTTVVANHLRSLPISSDERNLDDTNAEQHIANVMSRFYNAEFAFCILSKHGVYFGRDLWGRRSLLFWNCPKNCGSFLVVSVPENCPYTATAISPKRDESSSETSNHPFIEWTEVRPGMVHCIRFLSPTEKIPSVVYPEVSFPLLRLPKEMSIPPIPQKVLSSQSQFLSEAISERLWRFSLELEHCLRRAINIRLDHSDRRSTGILFSGGVDSVVLAALAAEILSSQHRAEKQARFEAKLEASDAQSSISSQHLQCSVVPILYLYNVSFGPNPEKSADRIAALKSYNTLKEKYRSDNTDGSCDLEIIFRDIVVDWENICRTEPHIRTLISPKSTVMDVNIGTALWFASRGQCVREESKDSDVLEDNDRSPRVLLLGMGADELMGGYGRHRKAYERGGWEELKSELTMDQNRLWERNCGRDDRLCSDHGREARFPFLDAHVVRLLQETMASEDGLVCDFRLPPGTGDKMVLRIVAERLGMEHASGLVKRAIQFGSRISHLSDKKRFGSRRKAKGVTKI